MGIHLHRVVALRLEGNAEAVERRPLVPIVSRLGDVMAERGIGLCDLADEVGITAVNLSRIKTSRIRSIRFSTLEALCDALGCQPGNILEHVSSDGPPAASELHGR